MVQVDQKQCKWCGEVKSLDEYYANRGGRWLMPHCKECHKAYGKQWRAAHPREVVEFNKQASKSISQHWHAKRGNRCSCGELAVRGGKGKPYVCEACLAATAAEGEVS